MRLELTDPDALDEAMRQARRRGDETRLRELAIGAYHAIHVAALRRAGHGGAARRGELRLARSILCHMPVSARLQQGGFDPEPLGELVRTIRVESAVALVEPVPIDLRWGEELAVRWAVECVRRVLELWTLDEADAVRLESALALAGDVLAGRRDERLAVRATHTLDAVARDAAQAGAAASAWVARAVRCVLRTSWRNEMYHLDVRQVSAFYAADAAECALRIAGRPDAADAERRWQTARLLELLT